jgi:hypothetical protein
MHGYHFCSGALATAVVLAVAGCGSKGSPVKVEGVVTLDGKPMAGATVNFSPADDHGNPAFGLTDSAGAFRLTTFRSEDGALPGDYKVTVRKDDLVDDSVVPGVHVGDDPAKWSPAIKAKMAKKQVEMGIAVYKGLHKHKPGGIPAVYSDPAKTPLREKVPPDGRVTLELRSTYK